MYFLKYRPQTIEELDLKNVREQLKKILAQKEIPHALLFAGPKGAGKTSAARILAKAINCLHRQGIEPCNQCDLCLEITNGTSLDVLEIDAASNRGIDDIRQLRERVGLAPAKGKYKVYIIDEVHMLTKEAFNALLKTLEEPPAHVIFILCTTDPEKIIPTVLSRLIRIDFRRGTPDEVRRSLEKVIKGEKLTVDPKVIDAIIGLANGGFRDAQKILEGLVLSLGKKITWAKAKQALGHWEARQPAVFLDFLSQAEAKKALVVVEELIKDGVDLVDYLRRLLDLLRRLILIKNGVEREEKQLEQLAAQFSLAELTRLSRLFSQAVIETKSALLPQLPLQLAIIDFVGKEKKQAVKEKQKMEVKKEPERKKKEKIGNKMKANSTVSLEEVARRWEDLLTAVKPMNHSVAAFLKAARPKEVVGDTVVLEVFYRFHKDKLEEERNRRIVEEGLAKVCQGSFKIRCVLGEKRELSQREAKNNSSTQHNDDDDLYRIAKEIFGG